MTAPTVSLNRSPAVGDSITIDGEKARYLLRVRRVVEGDTVRCLLPGSGVAHCTVEAVDERRLTARVEQLDTVAFDGLSQRLILVCSPLRGGVTSELVATAAELGVDELCLVNMQRSVARVVPTKLARFQRVATDAARKVAQTRTLEIRCFDDLASVTDAYPDEQWLVLDEHGAGGMAELVLDPGRDLVLALGPEGGFEGHERQLLDTVGATAVRLGGPVYRARTAAVIGTALLLHYLGRL